MSHLISLNLPEMTWLPHPTITGIETKLFQNAAPHSPVDVLLAKVATEIPWHVHPETCEIAYLLQGRGKIYSASSATQEDMAESDWLAGHALIVPAGIWHAVKNLGTEPMVIFALHTK
jgi:quercetin dioxygenase-like cupin family protein